MPLTTFKNRFAPGSEGRLLQNYITKLETDLDTLKGIKLSLQIGGLQVRIVDEVEGGIVSTPISDMDLNRWIADAMKIPMETKQLVLDGKLEEYTNLITGGLKRK